MITHRTTHLDRRDVRLRRGLPVTSPERTLLDIAPTLSFRAMERALGEALHLKLIKELILRAYASAASVVPAVGSWPR